MGQLVWFTLRTGKGNENAEDIVMILRNILLKYKVQFKYDYEEFILFRNNIRYLV